MTEKPLQQALVVDDNPAWLHTLTRLTREAGYTVSTATTYAEALQELENLVSPDLVVTDIRLEDDETSNEDGLRLLAVLSERGRLKASIVVTGYPSSETREAAKKLGATYLVKGRFTKEEFQRESAKSGSSALTAAVQYTQFHESSISLFSLDCLEGWLWGILSQKTDPILCT